MRERKWTDETIAAELRRITGAIGSFPTNAELRETGRNDLACAVTKSGGLIEWAARLGLSRKDSDSDFGWRGEDMFCDMCRENGLTAERSKSVKAPFDVMIDGLLRVDVKTANFAAYGKDNGWYWRIGKIPQADVIALLQFDRRSVFVMPWWECGTTNVSIRSDNGKYERFRNNWTLIRQMRDLRQLERAMSGRVSEVA